MSAATNWRLIAGPCSVESREQILASARAVKAAGGSALRGGAYKPRTSPYAFQGLGEEGLKYLAEARAETGLGVVTEAIDVETFDLVEEYADCIQIGARNMQNFSLLRRAGRARKPILMKRGMSSTLEEFLMAAEYILSEGNYQVVLCERGVRTFTDHTRNTLDLSVVPAVKSLSHLPIIVDPSHGTGKRDKVHPMALAAIAAGAAGLIVEVHPNPGQSAFRRLSIALSRSVRGTGRRMPRGLRSAAEPQTSRTSDTGAGMNAQPTTDWERHGIRIVHANQLDCNTPQTQGMTRAAAIDHARTGASKLWAGTVVVEPNAKTGAHHHGDLETVLYIVRGRARFRWGEKLEFVDEAGPGDFIFVPPFVPHQEINADPGPAGGSGGGAQRAGTDRGQSGHP